MIKLLHLAVIAFILLMIVPAHAQQYWIQDVDFHNFSYPFKHPSGREVFGKLGEMVKVRNGIAYAEKVGQNVAFFYFKIAEVLYGDLTDDGKDEAAVVVIYGNNVGTFYLTNIYIYGIEGGKPKLISTLREDRVNRDYRKYFYDEGQHIFEAIEGGREIKTGTLTVKHLADGAHCCAQQVVTLQYRLEGKRLVHVGDPVKRKTEERDEKMAAFYELRS